MENIKKTGIVLKGIKYKETSKIYYVLTKNGIVSLYVRGALRPKNKYNSIVQPLNKIEFYSTKSKLSTLTDASLVDSYDEIKSDLHKFYSITHMFEIIYKLTDETINFSLLYDFTQDIINHINSGLPVEPLINIFELKFLYFIGYGLSFSQCRICGSNEDLEFFSIENGGIVCNKCDCDYKLNSKITADLKTLYLTKINNVSILQFSNIDFVSLRKVIDDMYFKYLSFKTKSIDLLNGTY